jgi:hypothetical protein
MNQLNTTQFLQQVRETLFQSPAAPLAPDVFDLMMRHPAYRGALVVMLAQMLDLPAIHDTAGEGAWLDDLDAFFDLEMSDGIQAAARAYPHVWWALWEDEDCLATYLSLRDIHMAVQHSDIAPLRLLPTRALDVWAFSRQVLAAMFPTPPTLRLVLRGSEHETVLAERNIDAGNGDRYQVTLSRRPVSDTTWSLTARAVPPPAGWLVLTLGEQVWRARFDGQGKATIASVPATLLTQEDGPPLHIHLELDQG